MKVDVYWLHLARVAAAVCFLVGVCSEAEARRYLSFIDVSGSMSGERLRAAREGAKLFVSMLEPTDTVQLISFGDSASVSQVFSLTKSSETKAAHHWIDQLETAGGTNYLAALKAIQSGSNTIAVFLSDGQHNRADKEVVDFLAGLNNLQLHTIGIELDAGGSGSMLLRRMASETGGTYCRVSSSEELVRRFAAIAVQAGRYRGHHPTETSLNLQGAVGRVLLFAFDGQISTNGSSDPLNAHLAKLPGEDVSFATAKFVSPTNFSVSLTAANSPKSRLGEIYVGHLLKHKFTVESSDGSLQSGGTVRSFFQFEDSNGLQVDVRGQKDVAAFVEVVDENGHVLNRVPAKLSRTKPGLFADIPIPSKQGITLRGVSTVTDHGIPFVQSNEQAFEIRPAPPGQPQQVGLSNPAVRSIDLGAFFSGSGLSQVSVDFSSDDEQCFKYQLRTTELKSGSNTISLQTDQTEIYPCDASPAEVTLKWDSAAAEAGTYTGNLEAFSATLKKKWRVNLSLTVQEPISANIVDLGVVTSGEVVTGEIILNNQSRKRLTGIRLKAPKIPSKRKDDLTITLDGNELEIAPSGKARAKIQLAVSPLVTEFKKYTAHVVANRLRGGNVEIPVTFRVVDPSERPSFSVQPGRIELRGQPGEVLQFSTKIQATPRLKTDIGLAASVGRFRDATDSVVRVVTSVEMKPRLLSKQRPVEAKLFLVAPRESGQLTADLKVSSAEGQHLLIPITLIIE